MKPAVESPDRSMHYLDSSLRQSEDPALFRVADEGLSVIDPALRQTAYNKMYRASWEEHYSFPAVRGDLAVVTHLWARRAVPFCTSGLFAGLVDHGWHDAPGAFQYVGGVGQRVYQVRPGQGADGESGNLEARPEKCAYPPDTFSGISLAGLLNGAFVVEVVFAWPGVGRLMLEGVAQRDFPIIEATALTSGFFYILTSLMVDILYVYVDPGIRVE